MFAEKTGGIRKICGIPPEERLPVLKRGLP
jgi:hypothetical protein